MRFKILLEIKNGSGDFQIGFIKPGTSVGPGLTMFTRTCLSANPFAAIYAILFKAPFVAE